jgi:hypothetical protein
MQNLDIKLKKMPSLSQKYFTYTVKNTEFVMADTAMLIYSYKTQEWDQDKKLYRIWEPQGYPFAVSQDKKDIYLIDDRGFVLISRKFYTIAILETKEKCDKFGVNWMSYIPT